MVTATQLYGRSVDLLQETFEDFGIVTFVNQDDPASWRAAVTPRTRAFFAESVANPVAQVLDIRRVAAAVTHGERPPGSRQHRWHALFRPSRRARRGLRRALRNEVLSGHGSSLGGVAAVHHPGIPDNQGQGLAGRYLPGRFGVLLSAGDEDRDLDRVERVVDALRVIRLVAHPASMTHSHLSAAQLATAALGGTKIRLSIGIEDPADLDQALARV